MANISAIKLPNNTTYNIIDKTSGYTKNTGTVTSVAVSAGTGISVSGSPITSNGTITISNSGVTGVKGSAESSYRTGQVNLTAANVGAAAASHTHTINEISQGQSATAGGLDPLTQAMIGSGASNKSFHLPAAAIKIEYSTNGGTTWIDYGATDTQKIALFSETRSFWALLGKNNAKGSSNTVNNWLRIIIEPTDRYVFFNGLYIWMTTQGNTVTVDLERSTIGAKDTFTSVFTGQHISGWSGNNIRYFSGGSFGGGSNQTSNYYKYRLTFKQTAVNTNYGSAQINDIRFLGVNVWTSPNNMVSKNHLYTWDESLNATFPAKVTASSFSGNLTGNVTGNVSGSAGSVAWSGVDSKPTTLSGYGITDAKISSGTITLGSSTITPLTSSSTLNAEKLSGTIPTSCYTDSKVAQTNTTENADYRILFSETADDTTHTEGARKNTNIRYNPSTHELKVQGINSINSTYKTINSDVTSAEIKAQNSSLTSSSAETDWTQALVKAICVKYPNKSEVVFKGAFTPSSVRFYEICIYNTSEVNSTTKLPRYSFGRSMAYGGNFFKFGTDNYTWRFSNVDSNTWNANAVSTAGYVAAPTASNPYKVWGTNSSGAPSWKYPTILYCDIWPSDVSGSVTVSAQNTNYSINLKSITQQIGGFTISSNGIKIPVSGYYLVSMSTAFNTLAANSNLMGCGLMDTSSNVVLGPVYNRMNGTYDRVVIEPHVIQLTKDTIIKPFVRNNSAAGGVCHAVYLSLVLLNPA